MFIVAFVVAIIAFAKGVLSMGEKKPGFYQVEAAPSDSAPMYSAGMSLTYYFEGDSVDIRRQMDELKVLYSTTLEHAWKLFDANKEYDELANIATINHHPEEWIAIDDKLCHVLQDALARSRKKLGYAVNAGPLYAIYNGILYAEDALENEEMYLQSLAEPRKALEESALDPDAFLSIENGRARLSIDSKVAKAMQDAEIENGVIDLNLLHDAYIVQMLVQVLEEEGWNNGYVHCSSGLTVMLSGYQAGGTMDIVGYAKGMPAKLAEIPMAGGMAVSRFKAFGENGEAGYYVREKPEGTLYRHPYPTIGGQETRTLVSYAINDAMDPVAACFENIVINEKGETESILGDWILQPMGTEDNVVLKTSDSSLIVDAKCKVE